MQSSTEELVGVPSAVDQQRDNLCGPFHAARLLREIGVTEWGGERLDQDLVALQAGTALPDVEVGPQVPAGASNLRDYRFELPRVAQTRSGTSLRGLVAAIERMSDSRIACVPLSGEWTATTVEGLLGGVSDLPETPKSQSDGGVRLIANLRTGHLWGSRPPLEALLAALDGNDVPDPPPADWDVGHFVELTALLRGRRGALVLVRDSYPSLGWAGAHLQPPAAVAAALMRGDGRDGGVLAAAPPQHVAELERLAARLGLQVRMWDNSR